MSTDIYGCIEIRHPNADEDWYDGEPWLQAMSLYPLYSEQDYTAFGCLFGVRNYADWEPVAAGRGLPKDASAQLRRDYEHWSSLDALHGATWVTWHELEAVDMSGVPRRAHGLLRMREPESSALVREYWVADTWPADVVDRFGEPPVGGCPATARQGTWTAGDAKLDFHRVTRAEAIGPGSGWEHVFAVMKALAGRFGPHGVRLVAYFD
ncbi:hypothetical protein [Streptomyces sp. enrichment culture]|uniref:hypothetical protein n=1 Tax=Streptomyces sp. enrichment culture TaxID=1795815 RepID=UPI003F55FC74